MGMAGADQPPGDADFATALPVGALAQAAPSALM
jgi:hypothetical protein